MTKLYTNFNKNIDNLQIEDNDRKRQVSNDK